MKKHLPAPDVRHISCKATYIDEDDGVVEKWRGLQEVITLLQSCHLAMAQNLFGSSFELGFRFNLTCKLQRLGLNRSCHPVEATDTLNVLPLAEELAPEGAGNNFFYQKGVDIKYVASQCSLTLLFISVASVASQILRHICNRGE
jgi:hypothetical protein